MNILIPHDWLLEHLQTDVTPQELQEKLSLCGPSVERINHTNDQPVYDIEVTTNRVDSMSVRGIAREAAVILEQLGVSAQLKNPDYSDLELETLQAAIDAGLEQLPKEDRLPLPVIHNDPELCGRITALVLRDVERTPTPDWMAKRLQNVEVGVHDSVIDITNYITHELGHPVHAFDYEALMQSGGEIRVVQAKKGKKFITLDQEEYTTVGGEVVFESPSGEIIDLPSIKGTANTSITDKTRHVLLLVDSIVAHRVRFASMTHQIRTTAAQLTEKQVDPHLAVPTLRLGIKLYQELCGARIASELHNEFPASLDTAETVELPLSEFERYLGLSIAPERIMRILTVLGCKPQLTDATLRITAPSFRPDLRIPADVIEEVARIYGYHNLPSTLMTGTIPLAKQENTNFTTESRIKRYLAAIGWQEMYTYSIVSQQQAEDSGHALDEHLPLANPLSQDNVYLRTSLIPSLQQVLQDNPEESELSVFELASVYHKTAAGLLPDQQMMLGLVSNKSYRLVRGDLEALLRSFFITDLRVVPDTKNPRAGVLVVGDKHLGTLRLLDSGATACEIELATLLQVAKTHPEYQPIAKVAAVIEDLTFSVAPKTPVGPLLATMRELSPLIKTVKLKDEYVRQQPHKRNLTFSITYHDASQQLSSQDIAPLRQKIVKALEETYAAKLVGELN